MERLLRTGMFLALMALATTTVLRAGTGHTVFKADMARTGDSKAWIPTKNLHQKWRTRLAETGEEYQGQTLGSSQILVANEVVYVRWIDRIYAIDAESGDAVWSEPYVNSDLTGGALGMTYANGVLFLPGGGGKMMALNAATKTEKWQYASPTGGRAWTAIVDGSTLYYVGGKTLVALDANSGQEKWTYSNGEYGILAHVALRDGKLVYGTNSSYNDTGPAANKIVAVSAASGANLWETTNVEMRMTLALSDQYAIISTRRLSYGLNLSDGEVAWTTYGPKDVAYDRGGGGVAISEEDSIFIAVAKGSAETKGGGYAFGENQEVWYNTYARAFMPKYGNKGDIWACVPTIGHTALGNIVVGVDKYGAILFNNIKTGNTVLEYQCYQRDENGISHYGYPNFCSPVLTDGHIFVALGDGNVYCLTGDVQKNETRWPSLWHEQTVDERMPTLMDVYFSDVSNGVAVSKAKMARTTDGGQSWGSISINGANRWFHNVQGFSGSRYVVTGQYGHTAISSDGGANWSFRQEAFPKHGGRAMYFVDDSNGWMCGHNGFILKTDNRGQSWTHMYGSEDENELAEGYRLEDIHFADDLNGIAVGLDGVILRTYDGGQNWTRVNKTWADQETNDNLIAVHMLDADNLIAVGTLGAIRYSNDGGQSWSKMISPVSYTLYDIEFINDHEVYIPGTCGTLLYSNDVGQTWKVQETGTTNPLFRVHFVDSSHGWSVGSRADRGFVIHTQQQGNPSSVKDEQTAMPGFHLAQGFPNPFGLATGTRLRYTLPAQAKVRVRIFDTLGRAVCTLVDHQQNAGEHTARWDGRAADGQAVGPGVYFTRIETGATVRLQRIVLLR